MINQNRITIFTVLSAFLYIALIVLISLSPLAELGPNANQFNSYGMWSSILFMLILYAIPLSLYLFKVKWALYVMAVLCGFGLFGLLATVLTVGFVGAAFGILSNVTIVLITAGIGLIVNLIWFFVAFMKKSTTSSLPTI